MEWLVLIIALTSLPGFLVAVYRFWKESKDRNVLTVNLKKPESRISLVIPWKGADSQTLDNAAHHCRYASLFHELVFVVESVEDPAYQVLAPLTKTCTNLTVTVAGKAVNCGQKNHNLLSALKTLSPATQIVLFLDSDITLTAEAIQHLIHPLETSEAEVTTGFQWNVQVSGSFADRLHSAMVGYQLLGLHSPGEEKVWGGALAVSASVLDKIDFNKIWSNTVVDDMSLKLAIRKKKIRTKLVGQAISLSHRSAGSVSDTLNWFSRQLHSLKLFFPASWLMAGISMHSGLVNFSLVPLGLLTGLLFSQWNLFFLGISASIFSLTIFSLIKPRFKDNYPLWQWVLDAPALITLTCLGYWKSAFATDMKWRGITYKIKTGGIVAAVLRD